MTRNEEILLKYEQGMTYSAIAREYGISPTVCRKICKMEIKHREMYKNEIFTALYAINNDKVRSARVFMMLFRNGVRTLNEFLSLEPKQMKDFRACGPLAINNILLAQDYIAESYSE